MPFGDVPFSVVCYRYNKFCPIYFELFVWGCFYLTIISAAANRVPQ